MEGSEGMSIKGNISLGKYINKTIVTVVPMISAMGLAIAFVMHLDLKKSVILLLCFLLAGILIGILASLKNYRRF
ncbi:hypothetical protein [Desulfosporosinus sp. Sb-LF]|uniref:hypothetical protein n=1 Tax=Desulfosporosinus sp. Sb-LF TaxID=2560027 RepID=UPI00107FA1A9|nr:hypothetical protein [Desulfosporosinus sp. Sb-LF]TGE31151.1 hypothetical protein E4K68_18680 [Desulfosporosinus sp. Sb-LF]